MKYDKQVRVCLLAYEVSPYSAQGELAEVVAGLSRALIDRGVDLRVLSPCHASVAGIDSAEESRRSGAPGNRWYRLSRFYLE